LVDAVLDDWKTAPIDDRLRAACGLLEKLTLAPQSLTAGDIDPLKAAGLDVGAIEDVIQVCAVFNMYDRIADALGFDVPDAAAFASGADRLLKRGYR
jgi:uncharacterized peroxidase-related enzyme